MSISLPSRVDVSEDVLFQELEGEAVLLNLKTERYYGLDAVGTRMWQLITAEGDVGAAFEQLSQEYAVAPEVLRQDMAALIAKLSEVGLLTVR
ncbi:MAG TPA: PqqD family protein [Anaerolineae bacterium]|nr:PqqD family protein [Anaerolineae bacterium]